MNYWLVKSEPSAYSWENLVADRRTSWDGVRNYQARNHLAAMRKGDIVLFYHSVGDKQVIGTARVRREAYPDPTSDDERWVAVEIEATEPLERAVSLEEIRSQPALRDIALVRQSRLSVMPVSAEQFRTITSLASRPASATPPPNRPRSGHSVPAGSGKVSGKRPIRRSRSGRRG